MYPSSEFDIPSERCPIVALSIALIWCLASFTSSAQVLDVRILSLKSGDVLMLTPESGKYSVVVGPDTLYEFTSDDALKITYNEDRYQLKGLMNSLKVESNFVQFLGSGIRPEMRLKLNDQPQDVYADDFEFHDNGLINNQVRMDYYVSRVLVEEVGAAADMEYLKVQAILSRTYAVKNLNRHSKEGFDLCNSVHCQVYEGRKTVASNLHLATAETSGIIVVDSLARPILSAFSANCGGKTSNSEDVWFERLSYLRSVSDSFCLEERSATWIKEIPISKWSAFYLKYTGKPKADWSNLSTKMTRNKYVELDSSMLNLNELRQKFRLRSTYFKMEFSNETVSLQGRGYGHGVGLCQQGAMRMAEEGYNYQEILGAYFTGVRLKDYRLRSSSKKAFE